MKPINARLLPKDGETSGWDNVLPQRSPPKLLMEEIQADWTVVGGGFSGLACARRLSELHPDDRIVLIDAQRIGQGNSGRNSGWLLNFNAFGGYPKDVSLAVARLQQAGLDWLAQIVSEHGIECDWFPWGTMCFTLTPDQVPHLEELKENCRIANQPFEEWPAEKVQSLTGVRRASKAFFQPGTVLVNPAALARGLGATLPANVELYENTPLLSIRKEDRYIVRTGDGTIRSKKVMLCVNSFTPEILPNKSWAVPIAPFSVLSRKLTEDELKILGSGSPYAFISPVRGDSLFRRTPDGRLMCRQNWLRYLPGKRFSQDDYDTAAGYARKAIKLRWPELDHIEFEHVWGGVVSMTRNYGAQEFGRIDDGIFVTSFCNGAHNTKGTSAGRLLADYASGIDSPLLQDQFKVPAPVMLPPRPFVQLGAEWRIRKMMRTQKAAYRDIS